VKKNIMTSLIFITALFLFLPAASSFAMEKIAFVDVRVVIAQSDAGKKAQAEFKKAFDKKKALIQSTEAELKRQKDTLDKQRPGMSEAAAKEGEMELQKKFREYQRLVNDTNEAMQRKDQELSRRLIPEIYKIMTAIGQREGYTLILDINNPVVVYASGGSNITGQVISELNKISAKTKGTKKTSRKGKKR